MCDYDDPDARAALVDALARDAMALVAALEGRELTPGVDQAAELVATVVGQDLDQDPGDGAFRIARRVAADRVISTVDPDARHGHKTSARGFDGFKGDIAIDPDAEIVTATEVTAANAGDAEPAADLLADDLPEATDADAGDDGDDDPDLAGGAEASEGAERGEDGPAVYGDAAYGAGKLLAGLETAGAQIFTKVQPSTRPGWAVRQGPLRHRPDSGTVTCPNAVTVTIRPATTGGGVAVFGAACAACPLATQCTGSAAGRTIKISRYEAELARARTAQADPAWVGEYKATRPKVERKIAHLMRRHGGRRA